jgi:glycosyltransferase involved in cell wall biosynthesis
MLEMGAYVLCSFIPALRMARRWKPDVLHVHFAVPTGAMALPIHLLTGIPYVLTVHLGDVPGGVPDQTERVFRIIMPLTIPIWKRAGQVTAVSEYIRELALQSYEVDIQTIPNGIELSHPGTAPLTIRTPRRLFFAGRFNPQKNLLFLVDLLDRIRDLDWRMEMVGDGPMMASVAKRITRLGLGGRINLRGWVEPDEVEQIMSGCDILVLPSLSEGMPVVGIQALAAGLAIVGSDVGGNRDIVRDGQNGYLCPVGDLDIFEDRLRSLLASRRPLATMKAASVDLAVDFDIEVIARKYEKAFSRASQSRR